MGEIKWIRPVLGITNDELVPLFDLLRGYYNTKVPRTFTTEAQNALEKKKKITEALQHRQAHRCIFSKSFFLWLLREQLQLYGLIFQREISEKDLLLITEQIFLPYRPPKTILETLTQIIIRVRARRLTIAAKSSQ